MSLAFAAIAPHPPLLIPNIGKKEIEKVKQTKNALLQLEQDLYLSKPDIIFVISPHGSLFADAFSINAHTNFVSSFEEFGDYATKKEWIGCPDVAANIAHKGNLNSISIQLISEGRLDHGSSVPLSYLTNHLPNIKIVPIGYSGLGVKAHLEFGSLLKEIIMETDKRIAVIASGDLSHGLTTDAPAGFSPTGAEFDRQLIQLLETRNTVGVSNMEEKFVNEASECGYRSFCILLGILREMDYQFKNYSYEGPFGVGYLVGNFIF